MHFPLVIRMFCIPPVCEGRLPGYWHSRGMTNMEQLVLQPPHPCTHRAPTELTELPGDKSTH